MNKRQAKKALKKKYGVNPNQMGKALLDFDWYKLGQDLGKAINDVLNAIAQALGMILDVYLESLIYSQRLQSAAKRVILQDVVNHFFINSPKDEDRLAYLLVCPFLYILDMV